MNRNIILPIIAAVVLLTSSNQASAQLSGEAFAQMRGLAGEWSGTLHVEQGEHLARLGVTAEQA